MLKRVKLESLKLEQLIAKVDIFSVLKRMMDPKNHSRYLPQTFYNYQVNDAFHNDALQDIHLILVSLNIFWNYTCANMRVWPK